MNKKDIQKSVWDRAFDNLDEEGNPINEPRKIKSDSNVNRGRANRLKANSPEIKQKLSESIKESYDESLRKKRSVESSKYMKEWIKNPNNKKKVDERNKNQINDPFYKEKLAIGIAKREADPAYQENRKKALENRSKNDKWKNNVRTAQQNRSPEHIKNSFRSNAYPIVTPDGVFEGLVDAHEKYNKIRNFNNGRKWVLGMMKKYPELYYKITWEEFDNIIKNNKTH